MAALPAALRKLWRRRPVRWAVDLALVAAVFLGVSAWQSRHAVRGHAPAYTLRTLDGATVDGDDLQGKPTVLVFWAPWCTVCRAESGNVSSLQSLAGSRAHVVSIASDYERVDDVAAYVKSRGVDYPVLLGGRHTARAFHVSAFPTIYFLDENGDVRHAVTGYTTVAGLAWRTFL